MRCHFEQNNKDNCVNCAISFLFWIEQCYQHVQISNPHAIHQLNLKNSKFNIV